MNPSRRKFILAGLKALDLVIGLGAFVLAFWVAHFEARAASFGDFLAVRVTIENVAVFLVFLFLWHLVLSIVGMYRLKRLSALSHQFGNALVACTVAVLLMFGVASGLHTEAITSVFLTVFWVTSISGILACRLLARYALHYRRAKTRHARQILIVGTNARALQLAARLRTDPGSRYHLLGFVDDAWANGPPPADTGCHLVANLEQLPAFLREHVVDEVIVCIPVKSFYDQAEKVISQCEEQGIVVRFPPDLFQSKVGRSQVEELDDRAVISFYTGAMDGWQAILKRALDIIVSFALLVILAPLFAIIAVLIKLTSPGPVLFVQDRVGYGKRRFRLYKFRTMVANAEQLVVQLECAETMDGPAFKMGNDPRITPIGNILRKSSIDELPQLLNVLKGDMSLVGPRPTPVREYEGFSEDWHRRRFSVRPGITGLWQISGRSLTSFTRRMELDMKYIDTWSLWLDLQILAKTVPVVLTGEGAV